MCKHIALEWPQRCIHQIGSRATRCIADMRPTYFQASFKALGCWGETIPFKWQTAMLWLYFMETMRVVSCSFKEKNESDPQDVKKDRGQVWVRARERRRWQGRAGPGWPALGVSVGARPQERLLPCAKYQIQPCLSDTVLSCLAVSKSPFSDSLRVFCKSF